MEKKIPRKKLVEAQGSMQKGMTDSIPALEIGKCLEGGLWATVNSLSPQISLFF
jgi:hypothetical protein